MKNLYKKFMMSAMLCAAGVSVYASSGEAASAGDDDNKVKVTVGGVIDMRVIYDSYDSYSARDGVIYFYPNAPVYDAAGSDLNQEGTLNFSVFASRINLNVVGFEALGADARVYVETDFLGTSDSALQLLRMRQAFFQLDWGRDQLLLGQASSINIIPEVMSGCTDFAGGLPYNTLNRAVQVRYDRSLTDAIRLSLNAEMYDHHRFVGPEDAQINTGLPAFHAQLMFGENSGTNTVGGFTAGIKWLQPRSSYTDAAGDVYRTDEQIASHSINGFLKFFVNDYKVQLYGVYGSNVTHLGNIGGFGKLESDDVSGDYGYANVYSCSSWLDIESPTFNNFKVCLMVGYQANLGSKEALDMTTDSAGNYLYSYFKAANLKWYGRVSPRIQYVASKQLLLELEYGYNTACWMNEIDSYLKEVPGAGSETVVDNRIIFRTSLKF